MYITVNLKLIPLNDLSVIWISTFDLIIVSTLGGFLTFVVGDAYTTIKGSKMTGFYELIPYSRFILNHFGSVGFLISKTIIFLLLTGGCYLSASLFNDWGVYILLMGMIAGTSYGVVLCNMLQLRYATTKIDDKLT